MHLHRAAVLAAATFLTAAMATESSSGSSTLPNLRPAAPIGLHLATADDGSQQAFRFDTTTWNVSDNHLDLAGVPSGAETAIASQCLAWGPGDTASRVCLEREEVGTFVFHPAHAHFHFDGYASYELRRVLEDDQPDLRDEGLVATGGKVSFCLMDTDAGESQAGDPGDVIGWYYACYVGYQGISARWGDTYTAGLDGQQIVVPEDLEPGRYAIVIEVNPARFLRESDYDDNRSHTSFTWTGSRLGEVRTHDDVPRGIRVRDALLGLPY